MLAPGRIKIPGHHVPESHPPTTPLLCTNSQSWKACSAWSCHGLKELSQQEKISQFILQHGYIRLRSSPGALWKRNAWGLSLVLRVPRDNSHIIYCDIYLSILLRQCVLKIKIISLKGSSREIFLKGTMFPLCLFVLSTAPLIINWVRGGDNGDSGLIGVSSEIGSHLLCEATWILSNVSSEGLSERFKILWLFPPQES